MRYMIGSRAYEGPTSIDFNQPLTGFYAELPQLACLTLEGEQACNLLQGQVTNNALHIEPKSLQNNLICNLKGQIITKIRLLHHQDQIHLICPRDLLEEVMRILEKPAAFSKVKFKTLNEKIYGSFQPKLLDDHFFSLDHQTYLSFAPPHDLEQRTALEWHYQRLLAQDFEIYPETCRMFHPHDLQLEKNNWIHFNKGCYRGQEIIARMHYRGKSKYQLSQMIEDAETELQPGQEGQAGIVVDFCPINSHQNLVLMRTKIG